MDEFSYLSVLLSIILGLAVAQILIGMRGRMLMRARVRGFWPVQWWAGLLLLVSAQTWWAMFDLRNRHDWDFSAFAILLAQVIALYLFTGLVFPDFILDQEVDLREHYFRQRRHFFTLSIIMALLSIGRDLILSRSLPRPANLAFHLGFIAFAVSAILIAREWYHKLLVIIAAVMITSYIALLFTRLD